MRNFLWSTWEIVEMTVIVIATVFLVRSFLVQPFLVSGASMEPVFYNGNYLLVDEVTYRFRQPERGEVIVFRSPTGDSFFIKRIIGLPGEEVEIKDGAVSIYSDSFSEPLVLDEPYLMPGVKTFGDAKVKLGENDYFVLGDNRNYSFDSRSWGSLQEEGIIGLVRLRLWPFNQVMAFEAPVY